MRMVCNKLKILHTPTRSPQSHAISTTAVRYQKRSPGTGTTFARRAQPCAFSRPVFLCIWRAASVTVFASFRNIPSQQLQSVFVERRTHAIQTFTRLRATAVPEVNPTAGTGCTGIQYCFSPCQHQVGSSVRRKALKWAKVANVAATAIRSSCPSYAGSPVACHARNMRFCAICGNMAGWRVF